MKKKKKKNYKTKDERENHKNDMKFMRIFHFLLALAMQPLSSSHRGIGAQRGMGRGVAERGNERGGVRKNILGNVLCRVLSFLRDFPPLFYYFFRYPLDAICSAHRYIYIYDMYIHIYRYVYASQRLRLSGRQNVFMHFVNGNWSNSSARLHDWCTRCLRWAPDAISRTTKSARNRKKLFPIHLWHLSEG